MGYEASQEVLKNKIIASKNSLMTFEEELHFAFNTHEPSKLEEANPDNCSIEQYLCESCDKVFHEFEKLLLHHRQFHHADQEEEISYDCANCYQSFPKHSLFLEHIKNIKIDEEEIYHHEDESVDNDEFVNEDESVNMEQSVVEDESDDVNEYSVERIIDKRCGRNGKTSYLIKWEGFDNSDNSWEPIENLYCTALYWYYC